MNQLSLKILKPYWQNTDKNSVELVSKKNRPKRAKELSE